MIYIYIYIYICVCMYKKILKFQILIYQLLVYILRRWVSVHIPMISDCIHQHLGNMWCMYFIKSRYLIVIITQDTNN